MQEDVSGLIWVVLILYVGMFLFGYFTLQLTLYQWIIL